MQLCTKHTVSILIITNAGSDLLMRLNRLYEDYKALSNK